MENKITKFTDSVLFYRKKKNTIESVKSSDRLHLFRQILLKVLEDFTIKRIFNFVVKLEAH